jgi:hypothetical protein
MEPLHDRPREPGGAPAPAAPVFSSGRIASTLDALASLLSVLRRLDLRRQHQDDPHHDPAEAKGSG